MLSKLVNRLKRIGITADFAANYPWIYIVKINGVRVTEKFYGNHGFTAFTLGIKGYICINRRELFKLIRKYCEKTIRR